MRPGDRRQRWESTCNIQGTIGVIIGLCFIWAGGYAIIWGAICILVGILDLRDAKRGWKLTDKRPPWADRFDARDARLDEELRRIEQRQAQGTVK